MLALVFLTACPEPPPGNGPGNGPIEPEPIRVAVEATVKDGAVEINKHNHELPIVGPGQRVEWVCLCDEGLEFTVADLRPVLHLERLADHDTMQWLKVAMKGDSEAGSEGRLQALDALARENAGSLRDVTDSWPLKIGEDEFTDETFVSLPVPQDVQHILWKFTWKVRRQGDPASVVEWDPHIETHPGISKF